MSTPKVPHNRVGLQLVDPPKCRCGEYYQTGPHRDDIPEPCPAHQQPADTVADLADSYARQVDELAATVEHCMVQLRVVANALGELHVALDEIAHRTTGEG